MRSLTSMARGAFVAMLCVAGCFKGEGTVATTSVVDANDGSSSAFAVRVRDLSGADWPSDAAPRLPVLVIEGSTGIRGSPEPVWLLPGRLDDEVKTDLEAAPLRKTTLERAVPCGIERRPNTIVVTPLQALDKGATYSLAIAGWALDDNGHRLFPDHNALVFPISVSSAAEAGAVLVETWPPKGSTLPMNVAVILMRFDGPVTEIEAAVSLTSESGKARLQTLSRRCNEFGFGAGYCYEARLPGRLAEAGSYRLAFDAPARDGAGAPVSAADWAFTVAAEADETAPKCAPVSSCAVDETAAAFACVLASDSRIVVSTHCSENVRALLRAGTETVAALGDSADVALELGDLPPSSMKPLSLSAFDAAGNHWDVSLEATTTAPLARLAITEVRADPLGPEPRQEFVELLNFGMEPIDLYGMTLSDHPNRVGSVVTSQITLAPGKRALLVSADFDASDAADGHAVADVPLARTKAGLATLGLSNQGEALYLRDAQGHRLSGAPSTPKPKPGVCIVRRSTTDFWTSGAGTFDYDSGGGCTPGEPDRLPPSQ